MHRKPDKHIKDDISQRNPYYNSENTREVAQIPVTDCSKTVARTPIIEMQKSNIAVTSFGKRGTGLPDIPAIRPSQKKTVITL